GGKYMLKKVVHFFFIVIGGTLGFLYMPSVMTLLNITGNKWFSSPYLGLLLGAIIFFIISYLFVYYIVGFLKWIEDLLIKIPIVDLLFGSLGLTIGLFVAYLINLPIRDISLQIVSEIVPLFLTIIIGYLGFQVGFRRREEFMNIITVARKEKGKKSEATEEELDTSLKSKILDTSVIIDGRIADICQTGFLEG